MKTEGRPIGSLCGKINDKPLLINCFILVRRLRLLDGAFEIVFNLFRLNVFEPINGSCKKSDDEVFGLPFLFKVSDDLVCIVGIVHNSNNIQVSCWTGQTPFGSLTINPPGPRLHVLPTSSVNLNFTLTPSFVKVSSITDLSFKSLSGSLGSR